MDCWDCSLIAEIAVWLLRLLSDCWDCSLIYELSQNRRTWNRGFSLVESQKLRPLIDWEDRFKKIQGISLPFRNLCHSTHFRLQYRQSDCNLHNQTAISAIRPQSQQSDCNLSNQNKTPSNIPDTLLGAGMCICKLRNFCNLSNLTAISAIWLQSQQSDCNLSNQNKTQPATCLTPCWRPWHV